ncbi:hypothetical protein METHB2_220002 [Candidatus Methylobacter favarea]|uniref:Uncharacterized protein n=1 Tax=Candidatus Methylobacter favarea TaxID=2707345 RepID=A0A8S0X7W5_9GAMM|nr:hypothetical protein METHB2_220002 [Candidatus Methylobacter favarea]
MNFTGVDRAGESNSDMGKYAIYRDCFVDLNDMGLLGTGCSGGDRKNTLQKSTTMVPCNTIPLSEMR